MPVVTVQLGQCGNQLGASWFDTLAEELGGGAYGPHAASAFFEQEPAEAGGQQAARAVLVDMEPKVIRSAQRRAAASRHAWCYAPGTAVSGQSGSGNNWAMGHNAFGPRLAPAVLEAVRRQVEACDTHEGFLMLQSMAGGTGAGVGAHLAEALSDDYGSAHVLNCCVWPYASGEVAVQPYNTLLSLAALAEASTGIVLLQNEALHATCARLLGIKQPGFGDLNAVAARGLAGALLPCRTRPAARAPDDGAGRSPGGSSRRSPASAGSGGSGGAAPPGASVGRPLLPLGDLCCHLFAHPSYRLASLRGVPQLPAGSVDFTTFTWPGLLRRLRGMGLTGSFLEEGVSAMAVPCGGAVPSHKYRNAAASSMLLLRGAGAGTVDASDFDDPRWHAPWAVDPLLVASHGAKFGGCPLAATLLSTDQACVAPLRGMLARAYAMSAAGAYVHQYEAHGISGHDLAACFGAVEDVLAAYEGL